MDTNRLWRDDDAYRPSIPTITIRCCNQRAGKVVYDGAATGMMGEWGPWSVSVPYSSQTTGAVTLRVFDLSAKDGSVIDLVDVPLTAG